MEEEDARLERSVGDDDRRSVLIMDRRPETSVVSGNEKHKVVYLVECWENGGVDREGGRVSDGFLRRTVEPVSFCETPKSAEGICDELAFIS